MCKTYDFKSRITRTFYTIMAVSGVLLALTIQGGGVLAGLLRVVGFGQFFVYIVLFITNKNNMARQSFIIIYGAMLLEVVLLALSIGLHITSGSSPHEFLSDAFGGVMVIWALYRRHVEINKLLGEARRIQNMENERQWT